MLSSLEDNENKEGKTLAQENLDQRVDPMEVSVPEVPSSRKKKLPPASKKGMLRILIKYPPVSPSDTQLLGPKQHECSDLFSCV